MTDALEPDSIAQCLDHGVLTHDLGERLRAEAAVDGLASRAGRFAGGDRAVCHRSPCAGRCLPGRGVRPLDRLTHR